MAEYMIEPRLPPAAIDMHRRLERKLSVCFDFCLERMTAAAMGMRRFADQYDTPEARRLLAEFEDALSEIREAGASELLNQRTLSAVERRLRSLWQDLDTLRG